MKKWLLAGGMSLLATGSVCFQGTPVAHADATRSVDEAVVAAMAWEDRSPFVVEYEGGTLKMAMPLGIIYPSPELTNTTVGLCREFQTDGRKLSSIEITDMTGRRGWSVNAKRVCKDVRGEDESDWEQLVSRRTSRLSSLPDGYWSGNGRASFGPVTPSPEERLRSLAATEDTIPANLKKHISAWEASAFRQGETLVVVLPNSEGISDTIFSSVIEAGVCASAWEEEGAYWAGIPVSKIVILNKLAAQGYVFQGGFDACWASGKMTASQGEEDRFARSSKVFCPDDLNACLRGS